MTTKYIREITVKYGRKKDIAPVRNPSDIATFVRKKVIKNNTKEHFVLLCLDGAHDIVAYHTVAIGTANSCPVHPREVFQPAIMSGAVSIVIVHNHPSGHLEPSREDDKVTRDLREAAKLLGIKLLDHLIVTDTSFLSYHESGRM